MAFTKKTWTDRLVEYPSRRQLTKTDGTTEIVDVARSEGTVSQEGDAFSAENMNDLENRIAYALGITTGILSAGSTSITLQSAEITTNSILSFYTSIYGVSPTSVAVGSKKVVLTFDAQETDMEVGVRVDG